LKQFAEKSSSLPFGQDVPLSAISGPTYLTAQTLVQQVAYTLSDKVFAYSPETFDLDVALKSWRKATEQNAYSYTPGIHSLETRTGAGSIALGYMFSKDFDLSKRHIPQTIVASSGSLSPLRPALEQLALLYSVANPLVAHVASVDYTSSGLVSDYQTALTLADELGLGLASSTSPYEVQHMSLFATLLASVVPTIHTYDGINVSRETTRVVDVLDKKALYNTYQTILKAIPETEKKHSDNEGRTVRLLKAFNEELGTDYKLFEYHGHAAPESVLVVFGSVEASLAALVANALAKTGEKVGVINVRVYRPFVEEEFLAALPASVRNIGVLGQVKDEAAVSDGTEHSRLFSDVLAAVNFSWAPATKSPAVVDMKYGREQVWTPKKMINVFAQLRQGAENAIEEEQPIVDILDASVKQYTFWNVGDASSVNAPAVLGHLISSDSSVNVSVRNGHDNLVRGGVVRTDIRTSSKSIEAAYSVEGADVAVVLEVNSSASSIC